MSCRVRRFAKEKICLGDLRHQIDLVARQLAGQQPGDWDDTGVTFTPFATGEWAAIETVDGTSRFSGVNIDTRTTHLVYMRHRTDWTDIEAGNTFIVLADGRRLRVLRAANNDEDGIYDIVQCTERGEDEASEA